MTRAFLLHKILRITLTSLVAVALLISAAVVNAADVKQDDRWRFSITPYIWLPGVSGSMKLDLPSGLGSGDVNTGGGSLLENLTFAGMLNMQAQKGRWSLLSDLLYVSFSDDDRTAHFPGVFPSLGGWTVGADTEFKAFVAEFAGAYTVFQNAYLDFDLLAGLRYAGTDSKATLNIVGPLPTGVPSLEFSQSETFIDPIIGFRGKFDLGKKWYLPYYFDIGGFSVDSDLTLQAFGGIGYRFCDWFSMVLGYRYLYYDFGNSKLVKDVNLYGGTLGAVFTF